MAEHLFHQHGYADTTMDQIVSELGVTKPFVYYYFRNKLEIFELLSWEPTVAVFTVLDDPDDGRPAHEKVASALEEIIRITVEYYPSAFFAFREPQVFRPEFAAATKKLANHFYDKLCAQMEQARAEGTRSATPRSRRSPPAVFPGTCTLGTGPTETCRPSG